MPFGLLTFVLQWWRPIAFAALIAGALVWHWRAVNDAHRAGRAAALAEIAAANEAARKKADDAISAPDFATCPLNKWNREIGKCEP